MAGFDEENTKRWTIKSVSVAFLQKVLGHNKEGNYGSRCRIAAW